MSQTLFTVCLFAGALAMVSAQTWDWQGCSSRFQTEMNRARDSMMQAGQKFANQMQDTAGQAVDMSAIQKNIEKMTQSITSLSDMSNIDMGRVTSVYMENMQTMIEMGRQTWRPALVSGSMGSYLDFWNSLWSANTGFIQGVTNACMPGNRRS